ncbi:hypothetical protein GCM10009727_83790 [Actinomadura napierensis]|uniref:Uncharacterized protein n=1 Tax=Actinomadura napierensis TaxID=267854 RepID=A0ABN3AFR4_9ACTN
MVEGPAPRSHRQIQTIHRRNLMLSVPAQRGFATGDTPFAPRTLRLQAAARSTTTCSPRPATTALDLSRPAPAAACGATTFDGSATSTATRTTTPLPSKGFFASVRLTAPFSTACKAGRLTSGGDAHRNLHK